MDEIMSWEYMSPDEQDRERKMAEGAERFADIVAFRNQLRIIAKMATGALKYGDMSIPAARRALVEMLRKELAELAELV